MPSHPPEMSAVIWRRVAALVYDSLILLALSFAYGAITLAIFQFTEGRVDSSYKPVLDGWLFQAGWFSVLSGFYIYFWRKAGQTVGMRTWRLKLVDHCGQPPSFQQCLLRCFVAPLCIFGFGIGYLWALANKRQDCLQDTLTRTRTILTAKKS